MSKTEDLQKKIAQEIKSLGEIHDLISNTPVLDELPEEVTVEISSNEQLLIRVRDDYDLLLTTLKTIRKGKKKELKIRTNWFSCGVMLWSWEIEQLDVWFECSPDAIPIELMPSDTCRVEEHIEEPKKTYSIVCDIKGGV